LQEGAGSILAEFINKKSLIDVEPKNGNYTWNTKRKVRAFVMERLDRFLLSEESFDKGFEVESFILKGNLSDHCPICLDISKREKSKIIPFRFEAMWHDHPDLENRTSK